MASIRGQGKRAGLKLGPHLGKRAFPTKVDAEAFQRQQGSTGRRWRSYRCPECGQWHNGRK